MVEGAFPVHILRGRVLTYGQEHGGQDRPLFSWKGIRYVRNVSLSLCSRGDTIFLGLTRTACDCMESCYTMTPRERKDFVHDKAVDQLK